MRLVVKGWDFNIPHKPTYAQITKGLQAEVKSSTILSLRENKEFIIENKQKNPHFYPNWYIK